MKNLLDKIIKPKKTKAKDVATEAMVESIVKEIKKEVSKEVEVYPKPNHFPDCNCFKCERWKQQEANNAGK